MARVYTKLFPPGYSTNKLHGFYMNDIMKKNLDLARRTIKKDWDMVYLIDGAEGSGKSVLAQQIGFYCAPRMKLKNIVFNPDDFRKRVLDSGKYDCVIFDEAYAGLSSRKAMSDINKGLVAMLTEIRQKNLFIIVVLPSFFDMDKYVALWRSRFLVHVFAHKFRRGYFTFYNFNKKKRMYILGKKYYNYRAVIPSFRGSFTDFYPLGKEKYKKLKADSLKAYKPEEGFSSYDVKLALIAYKKQVAWRFRSMRGMAFNNSKDLAKLLGCSDDSIREYWKQGLKDPKNLKMKDIGIG